MPTSATPIATAAVPADTKERLLDAAERLFAEHGFQGTSMRAVTQSAGSAVSAANYHFGSKEELLAAVLRRRVEPVNRRRLERLDALEAQPVPPPVESVLDAFLRPLLEVRAERIASGDVREYFRQVSARLYADPKQIVMSLRRELFTEVHERFVAALRRALPDARKQDVELAMQLTVGVMVHVISGQLEEDPAGTSGYEPVLDRMVAFASAGIRAATMAPECGTEAADAADLAGGER